MDILFLGTSSGVPTKERNVTSIALIEENSRAWYMIDCGEATQHQLLNTSLSLNDLEIIFITHVHGDHCYGLPGLLASAGMNGNRKKPLIVVAPDGIQQWLESTIELTQMYLPYELNFFSTEKLHNFSYRDLLINSCALSHRVPSYAYSFLEEKPLAKLDTEKLKQSGIPAGPLWHQLQKGADIEFEGEVLLCKDYLIQTHPARKLVVAGDNDQPGLLKDFCENAQLLIHEATFTHDLALKMSHAGHSSAEMVSRFAESIALPNLLLTHFSPRYNESVNNTAVINPVEAEAKLFYKNNLFMARDYARYKLNKSGIVTEVQSS